VLTDAHGQQHRALGDRINVERIQGHLQRALDIVLL